MSMGTGKTTLLRPDGAAAVPSLSLYDRQAVGTETLIFQDEFDLHDLNSLRPHGHRWTGVDGTMPQIMSTANGLGCWTFNSTNATTGPTTLSGATLKRFAIGAGLHLSWVFQVNSLPSTGSTRQFGFAGGGLASASAQTEGAFFRWTNDGTFRAVIAYNGVETSSAALANPAINARHVAEIYLYETKAVFALDGSVVATVDAPTADYAIFALRRRMAIFGRLHIPTSDANGPDMKIAHVRLYAIDAAISLSHVELAASMGLCAHSESEGGGVTANWTNNTAPAAATLSNTTAGYSKLGGKFLFNMVAAAETDYALFVYTMPAHQQLFITGIMISSSVTVTLGTSGALLEWMLGVNSSEVSLATADSAGFNGSTRAPRMTFLGSQHYAPSSVASTQARDIVLTFPSPIVCDGDPSDIVTAERYVHIVLRIPVGGATGTIRGQVNVNGYFGLY